MPTNISYANTDTILESLVLHTLPDFGKHGDGIINNNFLLALLKANNRLRVSDGGLEFWKGILKAENSNFKWQTHTANMSANLQDPSARLRYDIKTFTGSIVINELHKAQNKGRAAMKRFAQTLRDQANATIPNQFNSAFWNTSPASNEPESVPNLISATPTTGTIGGLSRSGNSYLQNGADGTAVTDIGAEAGLKAVWKNIYERAISARDMVDTVIMGHDNYSALVAYLGTLNRYRPDDRMLKLGFDTIKMGKTTVSFENTLVSGGASSINAGYLYGINSNYFNFEVLRDGNFKWNPDGFAQVGQSLNKALYFWVFCNLTTSLPRAHFVMTSVANA
jgi:hypothetical protein